MTKCFKHCYVNESYGITECGSIAKDNIIDSTLQYRLISVPEMGYTVDDQPYPRGELCVKTNEMFSGYFNNPEETQAAFTEDGFFRTGDIVEIVYLPFDKRHVNVIDRKKNFFKLSQGQFISPDSLENVFIQSHFVEQIYIHGDLLADSVVAVIVPNHAYAKAYALKHDIEDFDIDNANSKFCETILQDLRSIAEKELLRKHEIPSRVLIDCEPFTVENGLLTSTFKLCRHKLAAHYHHRLKQLNNIKQQLKSIVETTTQQSLVNDGENNNFLPTGGDSLTTIRLSRKIENDLGISIPIDILLKPDMTLPISNSNRKSYKNRIDVELFRFTITE
ncbi:hypothetical protein I4U23_010177 [Adineta vaga]|nr:hypothetical protein I4U23_010177 [Adineta vaga]